jgi:hypothetical protein
MICDNDGGVDTDNGNDSDEKKAEQDHGSAPKTRTSSYQNVASATNIIYHDGQMRPTLASSFPARRHHARHFVILNLFQENIRRHCVIPKQVRDDESGSGCRLRRFGMTKAVQA